MPDFAYDEMKKLFPGDDDDTVLAKIQALDQQPDQSSDPLSSPSALNALPDAPSTPQTNIQGPDTLITAPADPYKDMAIQNVKDKYGLTDKYSDAERQKLVDEVKQSAAGPNWAAGFSALGAGLSRLDPSKAADETLKEQQAARDNKLNLFDTGKQQALKSRDDDTTQAKLLRETDPNSTESKLAQDLAVQMGMDPEQAKSLTAQKFKEFSPVLEKKYDIAQQIQGKKDIANENAQTRLEIAKTNAANRQDTYAQRGEDKKSDNSHKDSLALETALDKGWAARGGQAGVVQGKVTAAQAAQALIDQGRTQPGGLDSRQIEELAQSTGRLLGGSPAASARIEALVPHTWLGRAQTLNEWLTNSPKGQDMQAFTDRMAETVKREKELAENQMKEYQIQTLPAFSRLKKNDPDQYNAILQAKGIDPEMIDEKGRYTKRPSLSSGSDSKNSADQTKVVGGKQYKKVQGGWQEVVQ